MNVEAILRSLDVPAGCRVDQRIPKKMLVEHGAPTAADKRRITEGIEEAYWVAALKPTTIGIPPFHDDVREYLEIAVLSVALRGDAKESRLSELIHRAIPYPVFLMITLDKRLLLSLAHKRWSQGEGGATVLDGEMMIAELTVGDAELCQAFLSSLAMVRQPRTHLHALYQGWMDKVSALMAARVTGAFTTSDSPEQAAARREALLECAELDAQIARLRVAAAKEKQMARLVELNLEVKRLERQRFEVGQRL